MKLNKNDIYWSKDHENILIDWADKAMCYKWLHSKSNAKYSNLNSWFTIPVIIMSTLTGTANFAQERLPENYQHYAPVAIGAVNILAGIITTIQQFFKISDINEAHRVSSISWDKFYRKIKVELAKSPEERHSVYDFLKSATEEYDRLMEISPDIDPSILDKFQYTFVRRSGLSEENKKLFTELKKPEICDSLESVRNSLYKPDDNIKKERIFKSLVEDILLSQSETQNPRKALFNEFREKFYNELMREPTFEEYCNNLVRDDLKITREMITEFMKVEKKENTENDMTSTSDDEEKL
jgi:hypothetical protein